MQDQRTVSFTLPVAAAQFIVQALGELPTKSGAFPVLQSLNAQLQMQLNAPPPKPASEPVEPGEEINGEGVELGLDD